MQRSKCRECRRGCSGSPRRSASVDIAGSVLSGQECRAFTHWCRRSPMYASSQRPGLNECSDRSTRTAALRPPHVEKGEKQQRARVARLIWSRSVRPRWISPNPSEVTNPGCSDGRPVRRSVLLELDLRCLHARQPWQRSSRSAAPCFPWVRQGGSLLPIALDIFRESRTAEWFRARE
jgi:hypothetical protein